ncbi:MAG TPA: RcpC/CpaB family pilus assembly protein [Pilimelia sp.]|nr:RcpC/CpaB family pilus assembly protein [Pilimelia sp.]
MTRRILAVLAAVALAAVGCLAVVAYVRGADQRAVAGRAAVWVLVATKRIPAGTTAARVRTGGYTERVAMPAATVPRDALGAVDPALDELAVTADVQARQLLLRGIFGEPTRISGGLALPEGKLAVSVEMAAAGRVAGYVRPGSTVAVMNTFTMQEGKGRIPAGDGLSPRHDYNHATRVLLPRIEVIGVGERGTTGAATAGEAQASTAAAAPAGKGGVTLLVTFAATQEEAERLVHATQTGTLYLALLDDTARIEPGPGVDNNTLFPG